MDLTDFTPSGASRWIYKDGTLFVGREGQVLQSVVNEHLASLIAPPPLPTVDDYKHAIVAMLDTKAQERRYDSAVSISTYVGSTNAQWAAEAQAYVAWRDAVWAYAYAELDKVTQGQRPQPAVSALLAELPTMTWPAA